MLRFKNLYVVTLLRYSSKHVVSMNAKSMPWLRRNGVNTNGAAAKVMNFDRLGKKVRPGTCGKIKVG